MFINLLQGYYTCTYYLQSFWNVCTFLDFCADDFVSDDLQFGFKKGVGCANAILTFTTNIDYFTDRGRDISASLDISKAFDTS